jgi:hypothetical protein
MKRIHSLIITCALFFAMAPSLRAEFLVLSIGENTAEQIRHLALAAAALVVILTLRSSRNTGGEGN